MRPDEAEATTSWSGSVTRRDAASGAYPGPDGTHPALRRRSKEVPTMYSILYIIGAIVVIIVVLRLLGLY
jgi:hypothetical protein